MRRSTACIVLIVASILGASELKIAVIDLEETLLGYKLHRELQAELKEKDLERKKQLADSEEKLKRAETELEQYEPGTAEYRKFNLHVAEIETQIEVMKRRLSFELVQLQGKGLSEIEKNIEQEIQRYAAEKNIDLILRSRMVMDPKTGASQRFVLYAVPTLDITADITKRLNSRAEK